MQMTNYETVKELVQGFAKEVEETKESMWTLSAKITGLERAKQRFGSNEND